MESVIRFIRELYAEPESFIPLHAPVFTGREKEYLADCIDSTFVSSVGEYVTRFEDMTREFTGAARAVAVVNGTCGLTAALKLVGVNQGDLVLTQGLTFVATANAVTAAGAVPVFLDSDSDTLGMSPDALRAWLERHGNGSRRIAACVPVHILGHACRIREICEICEEYAIPVVEDAAEGLGSSLDGQHLGTFGKLGVLSYNGNKTITTGGGGMILARDEDLGGLAKHMTATAKVPPPLGVPPRRCSLELPHAQPERRPRLRADGEAGRDPGRQARRGRRLPRLLRGPRRHGLRGTRPRDACPTTG